MAQWEGKSRGNVFGYKLFVYSIKYFGVGLAYFLLRFVAFYFLFFSPKGTKAMHGYFHQRLAFPSLKSYYKVYQNYYKFGQTLIDRIAIKSGLKDKFTYEFDGIEHLKKMLAQKKGGILISAHIGNFAIADSFFSEIDENASINLVVSDQERQEIKEYLGKVTAKSNIKFIVLQEDLSAIFEIHNALSNNEIICFTGDRYVEGAKTMDAHFLGKSARFPSGPFLLATRIKAPVMFVYVMKETNKHYHLYARSVEVKKRDASDLLKKYVENMEGMVRKYPLQWFNYFDFWNELK